MGVRTVSRPLRVALTTVMVVLMTSPALGAPVAAYPLYAQNQLLGTGYELAFEAEFLELINQERAAEGLDPLARLDVLVEGARGQAQAVRDAGYLFHNPDLADVTTGWYALGENVGYGPTVIALHDAFMNSPGHRANVMKDTYNYGGVGVVIDANSVIWVAIVFMYGPAGLAEPQPPSEPADLPAVYEPPFVDDEGSVHEASIAAIAEAGITAGCNSTGDEYCPEDPVTRAQMATFLMRALDLPPAGTDYFEDDTGSIHQGAINALAAAGMTNGCGGTNYCPDDPVSRAQMATFLARALDLSPVGTDQFDDDDGSTHEAAINALAVAGVTSGCDAETRSYCPAAVVNRAQMASFIARALGLV